MLMGRYGSVGNWLVSYGMMRVVVAGYEMAEGMTDQCPSVGRLDSNGAEVGDTCAWISSGQRRR
jgi:hypothetical protein